MMTINVAVNPDVQAHLEANWNGKPECPSEEIRKVYDVVLDFVINVRRYIIEEGKSVDRLLIDPLEILKVKVSVEYIDTDLTIVCATPQLAHRIDRAFSVNEDYEDEYRITDSGIVAAATPLLAYTKPKNHERYVETGIARVLLDESLNGLVKIESEDTLGNSLVQAVQRACNKMSCGKDWHKTTDPHYLVDICEGLKYIDEPVTFTFNRKDVANKFIANVGYTYFSNINIDVHAG